MISHLTNATANTIKGAIVESLVRPVACTENYYHWSTIWTMWPPIMNKNVATEHEQKHQAL